MPDINLTKAQAAARIMSIGDAAQLETDNKESLVDAINEVSRKNGDTASGIPPTARNLLITILRNGVFSADQSANITALETALGGSGGGDTPDVPDTPEVKTYAVSNELVNVATNNTTSTITEGNSYSATLTAADGYALDSVVVIMGGVDITADVYADGVISIASVTGNIEIVASATEMQTDATLPTDGLLDYFDLRNYTPTVNDTQGLTTYSPTQGNGALFVWSKTAFTSCDDYGVVSRWNLQYDKTGGTAQSDMGNEFSVCILSYAATGNTLVGIENYVKLSNGALADMQPKYNSAATIAATEPLADKITPPDYVSIALVVNAESVKYYLDGALVKAYNGSDYTNFEYWWNKIKLNCPDSANTHGTAVAIYNKALSDVEVTEVDAFFKTLEVSE